MVKRSEEFWDELKRLARKDMEQNKLSQSLYGPIIGITQQLLSKWLINPGAGLHEKNLNTLVKRLRSQKLMVDSIDPAKQKG